MQITHENLEPCVQAILDWPAPAGWTESGLDRRAYLEVMEKIIRMVATWQDERGAIIDPVIGREHAQTSCRFVSSGAVLLSAGRVPFLREQIFRGMDWCCMRLADGEAESADFWMRELMTAWPLLTEVDSARRGRWEEHLRRVEPEVVYQAVSPDGTRLSQLHNWVVYAAAGEALRSLAGLGPPPGNPQAIWGERFFDKYMPAQLDHFSEWGMYRDPGDPLTYDMTTRLQISTVLFAGWRTPLRPILRRQLRRGALTQLLYSSPDGYAPFGGRSNQLHIQEAILAAVCEQEAQHYRLENPRLAAAFKRQAHLHVRAIHRWVRMTPMRHIKNGFDPQSRHGCDSYAHYSVYSLFAASCLGLAWQAADDRIPEAPTPAELGGYVLQLHPAFHKVFACCAASQVEIDTAADSHYDATGLGRFHRSGVPLELGLSMPLPAKPKYHVPPDQLPAIDMAIGPAWRTADGLWLDLAALHDQLEAQLRVDSVSAESMAFELCWRHLPDRTTIGQRYELSAGRLNIHVKVDNPKHSIAAVRFTVPLLSSDGSTSTSIRHIPGQVRVVHPQGVYQVEYAPVYRMTLGSAIANRNGLYQPLTLEYPGNAIRVLLSLQSGTSIWPVASGGDHPGNC